MFQVRGSTVDEPGGCFDLDGIGGTLHAIRVAPAASSSATPFQRPDNVS